MAVTIHRHIGRMGKRSADDASVAMLIKEVGDTETLLGKMAQHTKTWRDAWIDILVNQTRLADSFHDVYKTNPRTGDATVPAPETPQDVMQRIALLHSSYNDLKDDMMREVEKAEHLLIIPLNDCKEALKPAKKCIEKRDHKKLDWERFNKQVETYKAKKNKSDREYSVLSRAETDLERANSLYEQADEVLRSLIPPLIGKIVDFFPLLVQISTQIQYNLLQNWYSAIYAYGQDFNYSDDDGDTVIATWERDFLGIQSHVENELGMIAQGKAKHQPMNIIPQEQSRVPKMPPMPPMPSMPGRKKPPPPPPPASRSSVDSERTIPTRRSISSFRGSQREESPPPPMPASRPAVGSIRSRSAPTIERDESPPPPLPGPRPTNNVHEETPMSRARSYGSAYGGSVGSSSGVTATPLAGLSPSVERQSLTAGDRPQLNSTYRSPPNSRPPPSPSSATSVRSLSSNFGSMAVGKKKPPPPPPKKKNLGVQETWVKALFTFQGQDRGDLSFEEGQKIKVIKKTESTDDWWEGEVDGRKGQFPANYTEPA